MFFFGFCLRAFKVFKRVKRVFRAFRVRARGSGASRPYRFSLFFSGEHVL